MKKRRHPGGVFFFVMETRKKISLAFFVQADSDKFSQLSHLTKYPYGVYNAIEKYR